MKSRIVANFENSEIFSIYHTCRVIEPLGGAAVTKYSYFIITKYKLPYSVIYS